MKSARLMRTTAITLFLSLAALAAPNHRINQHEHEHKHRHYKLIDIGAFGGPSSYFDNLGLSDAFGFVP